MKMQLLTATVVAMLLANVACSGDAPPRSGNAPAATAADGALYDSDDRNIVKKSRSNICYDSKSGVFEETLHYRAYRTMQDCLRSGGRKAK